GYCCDRYCKSAAEKIKQACACPDAEVFFLVGGTQANQVVIDTMLAPYEGVVSAQTGHVNSHEAGAIEFTGHKVLEIPQHEGKIFASELKEFAAHFGRTATMNTWSFPAWFIFPTLPNTERCTAKRNWKKLRRSATNIKCRCIWTGPAWHTDWQRPVQI
ncbi:MAG: hypothetical protein IJ238_03120, partial [Acidaminococcaceae bacterium]|nr:hypothetical protein [Acidaminococcaceae bacterium]